MMNHKRRHLSDVMSILLMLLPLCQESVQHIEYKYTCTSVQEKMSEELLKSYKSSTSFASC
jgi:hypothetical protein